MYAGPGGGGAALGGAIFVRRDAGLVLNGSTFDAGNLAIGYAGAALWTRDSFLPAGHGQAVGSSLFLMGGTVLVGSGIIAGSIGESARTSLEKIGPDSLTLSGSNSYSGGTLVRAGTLAINSAGSLGAPAGILTINGGRLVIDAWSFGADARPVVLNSGLAITLSTASTTAEFSGVWSGAGGVTKDGRGTLILSGANSYVGGATLSRGRLGLGSASALGPGSLTINGGEICAVSADRTVTNALTLNGSFNLGRSLTFSGPVTLGQDIVITSTNPDARVAKGSAFTGVIRGGHGLLFTVGPNPGSSIALSGVNTYSGGTTFNGGLIAISADANLGAASGPVAFGGGALRATGNFSSSRATMLNAGGGTFDVASGVVLVWRGVIAGPGGLTKLGGGQLQLTNPNSYSGPTAINAGELTLNATAANSAFTINDGGVLSGSGTVGPLTIASGGLLAPGSSLGLVDAGRGKFSPGPSPSRMDAASATFSAGGAFRWPIDYVGSSAGGVAGWGLLHLTGALNITANLGHPFIVRLQSLMPSGAVGNVVDFNPATSYSFPFVTAPGGITGFDPAAFRIDPGGFSNGFAGTWSIAQSGSTLTVNYTAP